jgi:hypothetical protein
MIFESPDGGRTVFSRLPHTVERVDVTAITPESQELNHLWFQWRDILTAAKHNTALKEALDRAQVIYELSRNDTN